MEEIQSVHEATASNFQEKDGTFGIEFPVKLGIRIAATASTVELFSADGEKLAETELADDSVFSISQTSFLIRMKRVLNQAEGAPLIFRIQSADACNASKMQTALERAQPVKNKLSWFDRKIDQGSSDLYFHYYGTLQHQQNMLQDYIRTGSYFAAVQSNRTDFEGKVVMDVGAGSGMLSLFSAQAGARKVYAVEASVMAEYARKLVEDNPGFASVIEVVQGKVEEISIPEKVDVLISEPIGTLLVNERMLETYLYARDHFLKPNGKLFPKIGRIHVAAFSDEVLHSELMTKASFWTQDNFYGVKMTSLHPEAVKQYFSQVVIDSFDPGLLVSAPTVKVLDFSTIREEELYDIEIPLEFTIMRPCMIHGIACWFDIFFDGSTRGEWLSTAPGYPATHWFQLRCVLEKPLWATAGCSVTGKMRLVAHARQSYDIHVSLEVPPINSLMDPQKASGVLDLKEPYYRQLTSWWQPQAPMQPSPQFDVDNCPDS